MKVVLKDTVRCTSLNDNSNYLLMSKLKCLLVTSGKGPPDSGLLEIIQQRKVQKSGQVRKKVNRLKVFRSGKQLVIRAEARERLRLV